MAVSVTFYRSFDKRINSTKLPSASILSNTLTCAIKTPSSILSPVLQINNANVLNWTYCYIQEFARYYFIDNIEWNEGVWNISTSVDVLASFRNDILDSNQYVMRSASSYDDDLIDTLYTTKLSGTNWDANVYNGVTYNNIPYGPAYAEWLDASGVSRGVAQVFDENYNSGFFVVGIVGNNTTGITYYAFQPAQFKIFINAAFSITPGNMPDLSAGLANAVYDPMQYINSCRWYPDAEMSNGTRYIQLGGYQVDLGAGQQAYRLNDINTITYRCSIDIPRHPDSLTYHYLNASPYTEYNLHFEPFGNIPIDSSKIYGLSKLWFNWSVDFCTGTAILRITPSKSTKALIYTTSVQYGVDIPISALVTTPMAAIGTGVINWLNKPRDILSMPTLTQTDLASQLVAAFKSNQGGDISNYQPSPAVKNADAIKSAINASFGQIQTSGTPGSFLSINAGYPVLYIFYYQETEHDDIRFGRPLCKIKKLSSLTGFCLCSDARVSYVSAIKKPLTSEKNSINGLLNSGVYIE